MLSCVRLFIIKNIPMQKEERQILVICGCGNKYHMYWEKLFSLDIRWPVILTCSVCQKEWDLFEFWKQAINKENKEIIWEPQTISKEQMIDAIYAQIADKTPSFWCLYKTKARDVYPLLYREYNHAKNRDEVFLFSRMKWKCCIPTNDCKQIWHPVMIGDVLDWVEKNEKNLAVNNFSGDVIFKIVLNRWTARRQSINEQSDQCIKSLYDLLPTL